MFLGTIKKFVRYTYDEIIREKRSHEKKVLPLTLAPNIVARVQSLKATGKVFGATALTDSMQSKLTPKVEKLILGTKSDSFKEPGTKAYRKIFKELYGY